jgi:uncharacterized protein (TIGR03437 family)
VDPNGVLYVAHDQLNASKRSERTLRRITPDGVITSPELPWSSIPNRSIPAFQLSVDELGRVLVLESSSSRNIYRLDDEGGFVRAPSRSGLGGTWALDAAGNMYEGSGRSLIRFSPDGERTLIVPDSLGLPGTVGDGGPAIRAALRSVSSFRWDAEDNLYISDYAARRIRRIRKVSECPPQDMAAAAVVHAGSGSPFLSPGTIFSLYGTGIGPETAVIPQSDGGGQFPTEVAGVRVLFGDEPAPLLFVSANQINGVTPAAGPWVEEGTPQGGGLNSPSQKHVLVRVERVGSSSNPVLAAIPESSPGLFRQGYILAAALNQDGTVNSETNPAEPGSIIVLFGTGGGPMDPAVPPGRVVSSTSLPQLTLPVSVNVGGRPAEILYAGAAPGLVSGVFQINARIAEDVRERGAVPVHLVIGDSDNEAFGPARVVIQDSAP